MSNDLTTLDFESIKSNLKEYMRAQDIFKDYDFEASNLNVLLDVLAYNTYMNSFYLNMVSNEMFLDSALLRDSVVSHAKELNYIPRSFRSARARVNITITDQEFPATFVIPRGTTFTGTTGNEDYTFVTNENILVPRSGNNYVAQDVTLYEGDYIYDSYVVDYSDYRSFRVTNKTVDTNSISVTVIEDNGAKTLTYSRAENLFGLNKNSQVFFLEGSYDDSYEVKFGDGVTGRRPKDKSVVIIEYRKTNGELPNGVKIFRANGKIRNGVVTNIQTISPSAGGSVPESNEEIKFNAPRAFMTQERAVTSSDYETLLKKNFSEINAVSAYGGENLNPPQYGKVVVAVDLKSSDELPETLKQDYYSYLKNKTPLSIDPVFVSPQYTYVQVKTHVKYNINQTSLNINDMNTLVFSSIQQFNLEYLNSFNKTLRYSRLVSFIDNAHVSIVSNDTEIHVVKTFTPSTIMRQNYVIDFGMKLKDDISRLEDTHPAEELTVMYTSPFFFNNVECYIEDDGDGLLRIVSRSNGTVSKIRDIGTINYETGLVQISDFRPTELISNSYLNVYARVDERDITSQRNTILSIRNEDIQTTIEQVRL